MVHQYDEWNEAKMVKPEGMTRGDKRILLLRSSRYYIVVVMVISCSCQSVKFKPAQDLFLLCCADLLNSDKGRVSATGLIMSFLRH